MTGISLEDWRRLVDSSVAQSAALDVWMEIRARVLDEYGADVWEDIQVAARYEAFDLRKLQSLAQVVPHPSRARVC